MQNKTILSIFTIFLLVALSSARQDRNVRRRQLNMGMGHGGMHGWMDGPNRSDDPSPELEMCCEVYCTGLDFDLKFQCYGDCLDDECADGGGRRQLKPGHMKQHGWMDAPDNSNDPSLEKEECCEEACTGIKPFHAKFVCYGDCLDGSDDDCDDL